MPDRGRQPGPDGEHIELVIPPGGIHVFDADGEAFPRTVDALPGAERRAS